MHRLSRFVPALLGVLLTGLLAGHFEQSRPLPHARVAAPPADRRLFAVLVDSLTPDDATGGHMPLLRQKLERALHGTVEPCTDAVTVPCMTAAITGNDRFSLASIADNFGSASGLPADSILALLEKDGIRVGYAGDERVEPALRGVSWSWTSSEHDHRQARATDDEATRQALAAFGRDAGLSVMLLHLRETDRVSHRQGAQSEAYRSALAHADELIDRVAQSLRPGDQLLVFGDHGHEADGRHFAGLKVPTYAAYIGSAFAAPGEHAFAITDHATIWGHLFGIRFGEVPWVSRYFRGEPLASGDAARANDRKGPSLSLTTLLAVGSLAALLIAFGAHASVLRHAASSARTVLFVRLRMGALICAAAFVLGYFFVNYRPLLYARSYVGATLVSLLWGLGPAALLVALRGTPATPRPTWRNLSLHPAWLAASFLLVPPTVYRFGGFVAGTAAFLFTLIAHALGDLRRRGWREAAWMAAFAILFLTLWMGHIVNFRLVMFVVYERWLAPIRGVVVLAFLAGTWLLARGGAGRRGAHAWDLGFAAGCLLALSSPSLDPRWMILPCTLAPAAILLGSRQHALAPVAAALALPAYAFFFEYSGSRVTPVLAAILLWPLWARVSERFLPAIRGLGVAALCWLTAWAAFGCRVSGIHFDYFFRWLPAGAPVESTWMENTALTAALYVGLPLFGHLLYARVRRARARPEAAHRATVPDADAAAHVSTTGLARGWVAWKLAAVTTFILGFAWRAADLGTAAVSDLVQCAGLWVFLALTVALLPEDAVPRASAAPAPTTPRTT